MKGGSYMVFEKNGNTYSEMQPRESCSGCSNGGEERMRGKRTAQGSSNALRC